MLSPLTPDGSLWIPEEWPVLPLPASTVAECLLGVLRAFFGGIISEPTLAEIAAVVDFPIILRPSGNILLLDLTRGPTKSFKDIGVRVAVEIYKRIFPGRSVLCATSGDTGAAVAHACASSGTPCEIYFPEGRVSAYQRDQMLGFASSTVRVHSVEGDFDACQATVKRRLAHEPGTLSANSISLARLLPQIAYYHWVAGQSPDARVVVPSGNFGNATAAAMAKLMGSPLGQIVVACNANVAGARFLRKEDPVYTPRPTVRTPATAMDVGDPSNLPRLLAVIRRLPENTVVACEPVTNADAVLECAARNDVCPHTAVGLLRALPGDIVVATADPCKFR